MATFSTTPRRHKGRWLRWLAWLSLGLLIVSALMMGGAGPLHRLDLVALGTAFSLLRQGALLALGAAVLGLVTLIAASLSKRLRPALVGGLVIVAVAAMMVVPWQMKQRAGQVPPIHDITTDMQNPPAFEALAPAREATPNAVDYPGEDTARQQREAYQDIRPITSELTLDDTLEAVEATASDMGWEIAEVGEARLEATATTRWFGFKDDVVVRLSEREDGVRVDVRSASRVGRGDVGTNARRIREFMEILRERVKDRGNP
ncbi:DUF1499 domain-containing protein [Litchfieldella xinjiangensis]|uniref:DUF1499 domain-containing protein n=1 Tax=Litchfieldella xinjiangensis TaxID=1166948 RepID=UPI0005BC1856|nr:DUF1499 domain-containing protein [Halomonas xinjiangensis]